ncbi:MAG: CDP-diacylglycerol--glycerol-3-phosphate 3-phosphatidyltransferase [Deltaproteobacteria bacterium]|nr:CDP-diacylglycerol--glycerol-3-phosphate 3-phosphatidyltransferase [Deltaproteobacteria bacterium]
MTSKIDIQSTAMTLPNLLTILRIVLTPLFAICLIQQSYKNAFWIFVVAGVSDGLDGLIARVFRQKSELGAYLDPIADKLLLSTAFIILAVVQFIPSWLTVIVIARDILILFGIALLFITNHDIEIKPSFASKITTVAQLLTVFAVLLKPYVSEITVVHYPLFIFAAIMTILSGFQYIYKWLKILQNAH